MKVTRHKFCHDQYVSGVSCSFLRRKSLYINLNAIGTRVHVVEKPVITFPSLLPAFPLTNTHVPA